MNTNDSSIRLFLDEDMSFWKTWSDKQHTLWIGQNAFLEIKFDHRNDEN
ncbi:hypothetical protein [Arthrobacter sp.]|nr:hypothetical protein [Arthrobacter sp.]